MNPLKRTPGGTGILLAFFILILSLVGCEKGTLGVKGGTISGWVVDSQTLAGVYGVNVVAETGEGDTKATKYATSDSNGAYFINELRAGEWHLAFDKVGYYPIATTASGSPAVVVVNNEHRNVPEVRMVQSYANLNVLIRGTLKDAKTGSTITLGTAQFIFGNRAYNNELPTRLESGLQAPATSGDLAITIKVSNYETYTTTISNAVTDRDLGVILLNPHTYKIVGVWKDVPTWVSQAANNTAKVFAYAQNRVIATASTVMSDMSFEMSGIPMGYSVSIEAEVRGYRMNSPVLVTPNGDFQGVVYQNLSLKNNFSPITRDVRLYLYGSSISNNDRVGGFCNETGAEWPQRIVTGGVLAAPSVVDLGINQVPTGYTFTFTGYNVDDGNMGVSSVMISDDGTSAQVVRVQL